jgi:antirestriction protein ArdC
VQQLVERLQPDIRYGGNRAFYASGPDRDFIQMPPEGAFPTAESFAGTLAHELGHWTGAGHRLDRKFGTWSADADALAAEELRAEICSVYLCAELGVATPLDNHAAYVGGWVKKLRGDKFEVFRAAKDARKMVDFLTGRLVLEPAPEAGIGAVASSTPVLQPVATPAATPALKALMAIKPKRAPSCVKLAGVPAPSVPQPTPAM